MTDLHAVLDTNVIASALLSPLGSPAKVFRMFLDGSLTMVISDGILEEYRDVLTRPKLRISREDLDILFTAIEQHGLRVLPVPSKNEMIDEDDRIFYDTAHAVSAFLVTGNKRHYPNESCILTPVEFLDRIR